MVKNKKKSSPRKKNASTRSAQDYSSSDEDVPGPSHTSVPVPHPQSRTPRKQSPSKSGAAKRKTATPGKRQAISKEKKRYRPLKALAEIRQLQRSTKLCIRKQPFGRLVREIQQRLNPRITHWQSMALQALQEATEAYLVRFLEDCNMAAIFSRRVTVMKQDLRFIRHLRSDHGYD